MNKKKTLLLCSVISGLVPLAGAAPSSLSVSYQNYRNGQTYSKSNFRSDVIDVERIGNMGDGSQKIEIQPSGSNYKRLRVNFRADEWGGDQLTAIRVKIAERDSYTLKYRVRLDDSFDFGRGGKWPGFSAGTGPTGGRPSPDGMSHRIMWIENRRDSSDRYLQTYHYHLNQWERWVQNGRTDSNRYGDGTRLVDAKRGTWYAVEMRVKLKERNSNRGRLQVKINGVMEYNHTHRYLRPGANWKFNRLLQVFFYGGGSTWAPDQNSNLLFDNMQLNQDSL